MNKNNLGSKLFDNINIIFFLIVGIVTVFPFWNIAVVSLNDPTDAMRGGLFLWPREFTLTCYKYILSTNNNLLHAFSMSVLRTVVGTILGVICTTILSYTLSRKDFIARKLFSRMFIMSMYFSGGLIPIYILFKELHLTNNFLTYVIPPFMGTPGLVGAYFLIIMRTFIQDIPESLQEAATIDGANDFQIFYKVILPLCTPVIATIALFIAVAQWSSWQDTYFFAPTSKLLTTMQYEMQKILAGDIQQVTAAQIHDASARKITVTPQAVQDSVIVLATVPILVVYPFVQKYFVSGLTIGAVKE
jgi:putative aldouronate transport system permease protein